MNMSTCHPEVKNHGNGFCKSCYYKQPHILEAARKVAKKHYLDNKETYKARSKRNYLIDKAKRREWSKNWLKDNPEKAMLHAAKTRAKAKNLEISITYEDIVIPEVCPILGITLKKSETGRMQDSSPALDRIDNTKGYTKENIIVISNRANRLKGDSTPIELKKIADFYLALQ